MQRSEEPLTDGARLVCFYRQRPPIIRQPPVEPLPEYEGASSYYGESYIQYPDTAERFPLHIGHTLLAEFQFSVLLNRLAIESRHELDNRDLDLAQAVKHHRHLRDWFDNLPQPLRVAEVIFPHHLKLQ